MGHPYSTLADLVGTFRKSEFEALYGVRDTMTNAATGNIAKIHLAFNALCMRPEGTKRPRASAVNTVHH